MPEKEGAEEKTTKSVVNKKQKQMMGEEGYDVARDEGRVKPSKDKKDGTTMTPSKEMEKTRKLVKGKSALERVKADIEKRYGKGAIMNVKKKEDKKEDTKEELDLTKVAESFGGHIIESSVDAEGNIISKPGEATKTRKKISKIEKEITGQNIDYDAEKKILDAQQDPNLKKLDKIDRAKDRLLDKVNKPKVKGTATVTGDTLPGTNRTPRKPRKLFPKAGPANTPAVRKVKKKIAADAAAKTFAKRKGRNVVLKQVAKKAATKAAVTGGAKAGGKFLAKRIPGVGGLISGAEAMGRFASGDIIGGTIAGLEGIASFVPGLGTAASAGLGAINLARDVKKATRATKAVRKVLKYGRTAKGKVRTGKQSFQAFRKGRTIKKKMGPVKKLTTPDGALGTSKGNKIKDAIIGKTKLGRYVRGASGVGTLGGLVNTALGGAKASGDAVGHVGRRSAGSM